MSSWRHSTLSIRVHLNVVPYTVSREDGVHDLTVLGVVVHRRIKLEVDVVGDVDVVQGWWRHARADAQV